MADWYVSTSTFNGLVASAFHYYAHIRPDEGGPEDEIEVERPVTTQRDARSLGWRRLEPGSMTNRFSMRAEAIEAAEELFRSVAAPGDRLLLGRPVLNYRPVLAVIG